MVSQEHEGRIYPRRRLLPQRDLVAKYWQSLGMEVKSELPLTYLIFLRSEQLGVDLFKDLDIPRNRALHGGQRYEWFAPIGIDDALDVDIRIDKVTHKQSKSGALSFVDVTFEYRLASSGQLAVREVTRLIKRGE
jgi:hypothetical protein